jgi:hypothetical protein
MGKACTCSRLTSFRKTTYIIALTHQNETNPHARSIFCRVTQCFSTWAWLMQRCKRRTTDRTSPEPINNLCKLQIESLLTFSARSVRENFKVSPDWVSISRLSINSPLSKSPSRCIKQMVPIREGARMECVEDPKMLGHINETTRSRSRL